VALFDDPDQSETSGIEIDWALVFCSLFCAVFSSASSFSSLLGGLRLPRSTVFAHKTG
jgi:hypothetical protein